MVLWAGRQALHIWHSREIHYRPRLIHAQEMPVGNYFLFESATAAVPLMELHAFVLFYLISINISSLFQGHVQSTLLCTQLFCLPSLLE